MHSDEFYTLFNLRQEGIIMSITAPDNTDISLIQCCRVDEKGNKHILLLDYPTGIILKNEMCCLDASGNIVKSAGFTQDEVKYCEDYIMKNLEYIDCYREWLSDYAKMFVTLLEHAEMGIVSATVADSNGMRDIKTVVKPGKFGIFRLDTSHNKLSKIYSWGLTDKQFDDLFMRLSNHIKLIRFKADNAAPGLCDFNFGEGMYIML